MVARESRVVVVPHGNIGVVCVKQHVVTGDGASSRSAISSLRLSSIAPDMFFRFRPL
jgi:hypothetical protein